MVTKKAKIEAEWDEEVEKEIEKGVKKMTSSCCGDESDKCNWGCNSKNANASSGAVYGLGFVGALIYFLQTSTSFWDGVWGIIQAILWPGYLVFELLKFFKL